MDHDSQDKSLDDVLSLMEKSYDNSEKPWDALKDLEGQELCRDLMDIRFILHQREAAKDIDVQAEMIRFKEKQNRKKYKRMLWIWGSSVAALLVGAFFSLNFIFNYPAASPKELMVFATDTVSQNIVLSLNDKEQIILDDESPKVNSKRKRNTLDYSHLKSEAVSITRKMLQTHTITIPRGKTFKLVLSDGTEIWLNANSKLIYPTEFVEKERTVFLEGEAYFKVTKNSKPFIVKTDYLQTRVLGTEFNIRSYSVDDVHVTLISGKVQVGNAQNTSGVELKPGIDATLQSDGKFELKQVNSDLYTYWKDGYFYFDQLPLLDIMQSIGRWYNVNVIFRNKEAMGYRMHFISNRDSDIENTIHLMNRMKKVTLTLSEGTLYVD